MPRLVCGARKSRSSALLDLYWAHSLKRLNLCLPLSVSLQFIPAFNTFCFALEHLPVKSLELCSTSFPLAGSAGLVQSRILLFTACIQFLCLYDFLPVPALCGDFELSSISEEKERWAFKFQIFHWHIYEVSFIRWTVLDKGRSHNLGSQGTNLTVFALCEGMNCKQTNCSKLGQFKWSW